MILVSGAACDGFPKVHDSHSPIQSSAAGGCCLDVVLHDSGGQRWVVRWANASRAATLEKDTRQWKTGKGHTQWGKDTVGKGSRAKDMRRRGVALDLPAKRSMWMLWRILPPSMLTKVAAVMCALYRFVCPGLFVCPGKIRQRVSRNFLFVFDSVCPCISLRQSVPRIVVCPCVFRRGFCPLSFAIPGLLRRFS